MDNFGFMGRGNNQYGRYISGRGVYDHGRNYLWYSTLYDIYDDLRRKKLVSNIDIQLKNFAVLMNNNNVAPYYGRFLNCIQSAMFEIISPYNNNNNNNQYDRMILLDQTDLNKTIKKYIKIRCIQTI